MESVVFVLGGYFAVGMAFGVFFAWKGVRLLDTVAEGAPITFRLLMIPGAVALWPVLLVKLVKRTRSGAEVTS